MDTAPLAKPSHFFRGQWLHALYLAILVPAAWALAAPALGDSAWLGISDTVWFALCIGEAVVHQVIVWLVWRSQLCYGTWSRALGARDLTAWMAVFFPLLVSRFLLLIGATAADAGSIALPQQLSLSMGLVLLVPALYTGWSAHRYFGAARACGGDHFRRHYREMPLVRQGAFALTDNAMYLLAFLELWAIALLGGSHVALVAALFQHAYIHVHWLATEKPDMELLYG